MTPMERLFSSVPQLPSIPTVVQALIASLGDEDANLGGMVASIKQDQSLSARVLRLANSSYYGASHKVGAIDDAVTLIGLNALRTLVIASGVTSAFTKVEGINLKCFWRHSMFTATLAHDLGKMAGLNGEFAYTAGLMHRIGQLVIDMAFPSAAREIAYNNHGMSVTELANTERRLLDLDHAEAGAELALRWNFPAVIRNALRWYITPLVDAACPYAGTVHLASQITLGIEMEQADVAIIAAVDKQLAARLALDDVDWADVMQMAREMLDGEVVFE
ncbi:HDOD domain-containing protein [Uliginosibacterium sp. H3]|uniref:HDOD domain-containing protein n=1 Tax=Uliginosibacterium silvisoli TaxID=3114758 RepID=A0ABU6K6L7_9RHOO|nr:HDOD domain-containing protein [Uliginosibacterium sp. H3]